MLPKGVLTGSWSFSGSQSLSQVQLDGVTDERTPVVPVPAAAWLLGSGLLGLVGIGRRRKD